MSGIKRPSLGDSEEEKRRKRLARNRESARECRRRKKAKQITLKQQIASLEADNLQLRLKLQMESEAAYNDDGQGQMRNLLVAMVNDESIGEGALQQELERYKERYSDYGKDRQSAVDFHISQLRRCLEPTQTTQVFLWIINSSVALQASLNASQAAPNKQQIVELWFSLIDELKVSMDQMQQFAALLSSDCQYAELKSVAEESDRMVDRLAELASSKNASLDQEMAEVQRILSATQIAKFILWIDKNPACMQMLEALWPHLASVSGEGINRNGGDIGKILSDSGPNGCDDDEE